MLPREHRLLLEACLRPDERAVEAWRRWRSNVDVDHLDGPSQRLVPLLYRNLEALGVRHPTLRRYKGVWRYNWSKNQKRLAHVAHVARLLGERSLPFLALKELALILRDDSDVGVRSMSEIGFLIHPNDVRQALDVLGGAGYRVLRRRRRLELGHVSSTEAHGHNAWSDSRSIDLHWHVFPRHQDSGIEAAFWSRAKNATSALVPSSVLVMDRTDLFFHLLVHGVAFDRLAPICWIPDAAAVARGPGIDWERLAVDAERLGVTRELAVALGELGGFAELDVPADVLDRLAQRRVSLWPRIIGALSRRTFRKLVDRSPSERTHELR